MKDFDKDDQNQTKDKTITEGVQLSRRGFKLSSKELKLTKQGSN